MFFSFHYQQHVCEREEGNGRQLLTTLAGLFVSNSNEDIEIDINFLGKEWQIKGSKIKVRKIIYEIT